IFPVEQPPLERGTVTIQGERILAVERYGCRAPDIDLGNTAVLPGLVNTHTHLDLTGLRNKTRPSQDFTAWLRNVIQHRRSLTAAQARQDAEVGLKDCVAYGTTLVGDISGQGSTRSVLAEAPL